MGPQPFRRPVPLPSGAKVGMLAYTGSYQDGWLLKQEFLVDTLYP